MGPGVYTDTVTTVSIMLCDEWQTLCDLKPTSLHVCCEDPSCEEQNRTANFVTFSVSLFAMEKSMCVVVQGELCCSACPGGEYSQRWLGF